MSAKACSFGLRTYSGLLARGRARQAIHRLPQPQAKELGRCIRPLHTSLANQSANKQTKAPPRDNMIPYDTVQLVSPEDNSLGPPRSLSSIMSTYSPQTHSLVLVSQDPPIVRLIEKREAQMKDKAAHDKAKKRRARAMETSEVQVSWESATGDLEHKVAVAKAILERGDRLELVFAHKKGAAQHTLLSGSKLEAAKQAALSMFAHELEGISIKWKEDLVTPKMTAMFYEPSRELRQEALKKVEEAEEEKAREKEKKKEERRRKEEERLKRAAARAS